MASQALLMQEFEQILLSNSGEDAFDVAIKLLGAKLVDELATATPAHRRFRLYDDSSETLRVVEKLYSIAVERWPLLASSQLGIGLTDAQLTRSIKPLLGWSFAGTDLSSLDATLEKLVSRTAKGEMGQYFTPREVISMCVSVLNPQPAELVMDPACGSGGFLVEAMHHCERRGLPAPNCLGIDFSSRSVKVAVLLAAASERGAISVVKGNSLDGREKHTLAHGDWRSFMVQKSASKTRRAESWGDWNRLGCDVLLTNPPFAGDIDDAVLLDAYESQRLNGKRRTVSREHLFLERAVDLLKPNGRLAIVLPQGILANGSAAYLREWLFSKCRILAVVGLQQHAFMPYTGVKTAVLFLSKQADDETPADYPILFAVSRASGKDGSGKPSGKPDYNQIAGAITSFLSSEGFSWADPAVPAGTFTTEVVLASEVQAAGRLDAEFYDPIARAITRSLAAKSEQSLAALVEAKVPRFRKSLDGEIAYLDISAVDGKTGLALPNTLPASEAPSRAAYLVAKGDVLVSTVRPDRNVVGLVTQDSDRPLVASSGFCVLRPKDVQPEVLFAYCKSEAFRQMLTMHATASMYPTVSDRDVLQTPFVAPSTQNQEKITELVRHSLAMMEQAKQKMAEAVTLMNSHLGELVSSPSP